MVYRPRGRLIRRSRTGQCHIIVRGRCRRPELLQERYTKKFSRISERDDWVGLRFRPARAGRAEVVRWSMSNLPLFCEKDPRPPHVRIHPATPRCELEMVRTLSMTDWCTEYGSMCCYDIKRGSNRIDLFATTPGRCREISLRGWSSTNQHSARVGSTEIKRFLDKIRRGRRNHTQRRAQQYCYKERHKIQTIMNDHPLPVGSIDYRPTTTIEGRYKFATSSSTTLCGDDDISPRARQQEGS